MSPRAAKSTLTWIKRAADSGLVDAQVSLAEMMANGRGGPRDPAGALALFRAAAEAGHVGAAFATGAMLGGGHEVELMIVKVESR